MKCDIVLIAHDIRSCHNVGSLLRTAEGLGVTKVYLTGYTPYPEEVNDKRLPHIAKKLHLQISKTALGAEDIINWEHKVEILPLLDELETAGYKLLALEQSNTSIPLPQFKPTNKIAMLIGREVEGIDTDLLKRIPDHVEIPMLGKKESFNVVQATAIALYHCRFN
jgi:tRNA G18 (ribose-2'-O)-methylase SpoU